MLLFHCLALASNSWQEQVRSAYDLQSRGQHLDAESILLTVVKNAERLQLSAADVATLLNDLGGLYLELGRYADAERYLKRSLTAWQRTSEVPHEAVLQTVNDLIAVYTEAKQFDRARKLAEHALNTRGPELVMYPAQQARVLHNLATIHYFQNRFAEAEALLETTIMLLERCATGRPEEMLARSTLASVLLRTGQRERALKAAESARTVGESLFGREHSAMSRVLITQAAAYRSLNRTVEAAAAAERALLMLPPSYGPLRQAALEEFSRVLKQAGRQNEAKAAERRARELREELERGSTARHTVDVNALMRARD